MATNVVLILVLLDVGVVIRSAKAFTFHHRSSPNFAHR